MYEDKCVRLAPQWLQWPFVTYQSNNAALSSTGHISYISLPADAESSFVHILLKLQHLRNASIIQNQQAFY